MASGGLEPLDRPPQTGRVAGEVEPPLGGDLFPAFRHQRHLIGLELAGDGDNLVTDAELCVYAGKLSAGGARRYRGDGLRLEAASA